MANLELLEYDPTSPALYAIAGQIGLIDQEDWHLLNDYRWHLHNHGYAKATGNHLLHREIMKDELSAIEERRCVDHINGNRLDNRRSNLRVASWAENLANRPQKSSKSGTGFVGVYYAKNDDGYKVTCGSRYVGWTRDLDRAIEMRQAALQTKYGEFAQNIN